MDVSYANFSFHIWILNVEGSSFSQFIPDKYSGKFSEVFKARNHKYGFAIKSTKYTEDSFAEVFSNTLKEYLVFQIASYIEAGPRMKRAFGFDLVIFSDAIEFTMEFCTQ